MVALVGMAREQQGVAVAKANMAMLKARQQHQQQMKQQAALEAANQDLGEEERAVDSFSVPVPPRPSTGYLARLWDNLYGEQAQAQKESLTTGTLKKCASGFKTRHRRRSTLREDVMERINDGAQVTKMLNEVRDLLEGSSGSVSRSSSTASASSSTSLSSSLSTGSKTEDPVVYANGPLKRLPPAASTGAAQKARRAVPAGAAVPNKNADFVVTAPASEAANVPASAAAANKVKRQCVCPHADGGSCDARSNSSKASSPKSSFWRTIRRRVLLV